jgi:hypothetical protein
LAVDQVFSTKTNTPLVFALSVRDVEGPANALTIAVLNMAGQQACPASRNSLSLHLLTVCCLPWSGLGKLERDPDGGTNWGPVSLLIPRQYRSAERTLEWLLSPSDPQVKLGLFRAGNSWRYTPPPSRSGPALFAMNFTVQVRIGIHQLLNFGSILAWFRMAPSQDQELEADFIAAATINVAIANVTCTPGNVSFGL